MIDKLIIKVFDAVFFLTDSSLDGEKSKLSMTISYQDKKFKFRSLNI